MRVTSQRPRTVYVVCLDNPIDDKLDCTTSERFDIGLAPSPLQYHSMYQLKITLRGHTKPINSMQFSPDGELLASACKLPRPIVTSADL